MILLSGTEICRLHSEEGKEVNVGVKETKSEQQLSSPSVRILENGCYFLSLFWLNSLGEQKAQLS